MTKIRQSSLFMSLPAVLLVPQACGQKERAAAPEGRRLNIVHIMSDDHSFQAISAYGHPLSRLAPTPNIDRLAAEGILFRRACVENSLSTPSRACLMTGLYSFQNGQTRLDNQVDTGKIFVSQLLQEAGYQTAVIGKWHMHCDPKGFDTYRILRGQGTYYDPVFRSGTSGGKYVQEHGYVTDLITDHALEFLEHRDTARPFCLFVHHKAPHRNWLPDKQYEELYKDVDFPVPDTYYDDYSDRGEAARQQKMNIYRDMLLDYDLKVDTPEDSAAFSALFPRGADLDTVRTEEDRKLAEWKFQRYVRDYLRCIRSVDDQVGRILDYLEAHGLMDNTVVVYTSDQGFYMGEHGWFDKRFMYEESFRTPLLIRCPGAGHGESRTLVQNIDFAPTYLDLAGVEKPDEMPGLSLKPVLEKGGKTPKGWRKDLYYHYFDYPAEHRVRRHDGVFDGRFKLIHFYGPGSFGMPAIDEYEFYDLRKDPEELHNVFGMPRYRKRTKRLESRLDAYRKELEVPEY